MNRTIIKSKEKFSLQKKKKTNSREQRKEVVIADLLREMVIRLMFRKPIQAYNFTT